MPKTYGTPTGYQPPDPTRVQRKPSTAAQQQQAGKDYLQHMIDAHNAYHSSAPQKQVNRPRGSSSYDAQGKLKVPHGLRGQQLDRQIKEAGG
jgi:hypothetical protein